MSKPTLLIENSIQLAWDVLERSGEITDPRAASRFLTRTVEAFVNKGEHRRLMLINRAIAAYRAKHPGLRLVS